MKWMEWIRGAGRGLDAVDRASGPGAAAGLLGREAFARDMQRHRALCNRAGGQFVLMVFQISSGAAPYAREAAFKKLASVISRRVRESDVAGRYDEDSTRIGVILPNTDVAGAGRFLAAVEELMRRSLNGSWTPEFKLSCEIIAYPEPLEALKTAGPLERGAKPVTAKSN